VIFKLVMKRTSEKLTGRGQRSRATRAVATTRAILAPVQPTPRGAKSIDPKWTWHYQVLLKLRDRFWREHNERLSEAAEPLEAHSLSEADSATDEFDHNLALAELSAKQDALYEVEAAIQRVIDGTYGLCDETGDAIPAARLRAVPWTRFGKDAEAHLEKEGMVGRERLAPLGSLRAAPTMETEAGGADEAENESAVESATREPRQRAVSARRAGISAAPIVSAGKSKRGGKRGTGT